MPAYVAVATIRKADAIAFLHNDMARVIVVDPVKLPDFNIERLTPAHEVVEVPPHLEDLAVHLRPFVQGLGTWINAPHVHLPNWQADADRLGVSPAKLANLTDAKERAFARLAWVTKDFKDFVSRFTHSYQLDALVEAFSFCGVPEGDNEGRLSEDLGPAARAVWWFHGHHNKRERWHWLLDTLARSGQSIMTVGETEALAQLPERLTLFRGFGAEDELSPAELSNRAKGWSWTDNRDIALSFSSPWYWKHSFLATATVSKTQVLAYLMDVPEFVITNASALEGLTIERLSEASSTLRA